MNEPLIEGVGCGIGLVLLYYFQVWRPGREDARARGKALNDTKPPQPPGSPNA